MASTMTPVKGLEERKADKGILAMSGGEEMARTKMFAPQEGVA